MKNTISFEDWYGILKDLADGCGENVSDKAAWRESWEDGDSPEGAFYDEYPEHQPE